MEKRVKGKSTEFRCCRIDQNTDDIEMNVLGAQSELLKYYQNISTNRALIIKIFVTIIVFFLMFTYIL